MSNLDVEHICQWDGDKGQLYKKLVDLHFIDELKDNRVIIHNWEKRQGKYLEKYETKKVINAERQRIYREKNKEGKKSVTRYVTRDITRDVRPITITSTNTINQSLSPTSPSSDTVPEKESETTFKKGEEKEKDPLINVRKHAGLWANYAVGETGNPRTKQMLRDKCICQLKRVLSDLEGNEDLFRQAIERGMTGNHTEISNSHAMLMKIAKSIASQPSNSNGFRPPPVAPGPPTFPQIVERLKIYLEPLQRWEKEGQTEEQILEQIKKEGGCDDETARKYYREYISVGPVLDRVREDRPIQPNRKGIKKPD